MSISLSKGQKISLAKEGESGLKRILVGLGWDPVKQGIFGSKPNIDCDACAIVLKANDKYKTCVYYGNQRDSGVFHHGDNLTGAGAGDDEQITIDLSKLSSDIEKITFGVNIYACATRKQDFGMIQNAYIRLVNEDTNEEICRYNLSDNYKGKTAMVFGEVYKHSGEWKFSAVGEGTTDTNVNGLINRCCK